MLQLRQLSGGRAGDLHRIDSFPCLIGRTGTAGVRLNEAGVWDRHVTVQLNVEDGFLLAAEPGALVRLNDETVQTARLRNGDILELGGCKLQCWLAEVTQRDDRRTELLTWGALALLFALQLLLIRWLW